MKNLILLLLFNASCVFVFSQSETFDFRQTKWGMSKEEVIKAELGNPYEHEKQSSAEYLKFYPVSLTSTTGYANIIYKFTNNSLVSVDMVLFYDFEGSNINCNNPLSLRFKIDLIQRNYIDPLLKKGYTSSYAWELTGAEKIFSDDERGRNPMVDPQQIEAAYLEKKSKKWVPAEIYSPRLKSNRTTFSFRCDYKDKEDPSLKYSDCNGLVWKTIGSISAYANSSILRSDIKPDI